MTMLINFLYAAIKAGCPLLLGTTGEIITEKSGSLNLGVEGMMYLGAISGFFVGLKTNSVFLALICAFLAGALGALIYAVLTVTFKANQTVTGLALTIFGTGMANFLGVLMISKTPGGTPKLSAEFSAKLSEIHIPLLSDIPFVGRLLFEHNLFVYMGIIICIILYVVMNKTNAGLNMRSVGQNPAAADAAGVNVSLTRYVWALIGGGICGLGGAYIALINGGGVWNNNCVNGQGWIAVALVIFASWSPLKALYGSLIFGAFTVLQFYVPKGVLNIPNAFYVMLPFVITALVLVVSSMRKTRNNAQPMGSSINYFREER